MDRIRQFIQRFHRVRRFAGPTFYLPSYSPQLNPEERLNADLKQEMSKRVPVRTKAKLRQAASEHMTMLEQTPVRVIGYFQDRHVKYVT